MSISTSKEEGLTKKEGWNLRKKYFAPSCGLFFEEDPLKIVRGERHYLYDEEGNRYLDCINNVAHVGHCHPHVTKMATEQMGELYTNSRYLHDGLSTYVRRLTDLFPSPLDVCFLVNSGSEANDMAMQLARTYTGGTEVISVEHAYHGTVQSCIGISQHKWKVAKNLQAPYCHLAPIPDVYRGIHCNSDDPGTDYAHEVKLILDKIKREGKQVSSFIMESMISCGGQVIPPKGYMKQVFQHVRESGGVCIADEVQVGFGRVGTHMWAFQTQEAVPDIVTVGKPIGNGHPLSAIVTTRDIADAFLQRRGSYFNTFGGNPVSMAVGHAVLDVMEEEGLVENARTVGEYALGELTKLKHRHQLLGDVRGTGLFIGLEFVKDRKTKAPATEETAKLQVKLKRHKIMISVEGPHDNVLKFKPPMTFARDDVDHLVQALNKSLEEIESGK